MIFHLITELFNVGWSGMLASGAWRAGGAGFEGALLLMNNGYKFEGVWLLINGCLFLLDAVISLACVVYFWFFWRRGGLKFSDPTTEAATNIASNKAVQKAAMTGAKKGIESQFNN